MSAETIVDDCISSLSRKFGPPHQLGRARVIVFGESLTCSISYSKRLRGDKYFYAIPAPFLDTTRDYTKTTFGEFALLICGSADRVLVLPRKLVLEMLDNVPSRRVDIFVEGDSYIMQTTQHAKRNVTDFLNAVPKPTKPRGEESRAQHESSPEAREHVRVQWQLIQMGRAEGCNVWIPVADRNLKFKNSPFEPLTLERLPNFGFDQTTRRIVENIDVLWLQKIRSAKHSRLSVQLLFTAGS